MTKLFNADAIAAEWRTTPTDLGGWANRATAMFNLAREYHQEIVDHKAALESVRPITPHVRGCDQPDDSHCVRCVLDSEIARLDEVLAA